MSAPDTAKKRPAWSSTNRVTLTILTFEPPSSKYGSVSPLSRRRGCALCAISLSCPFN